MAVQMRGVDPRAAHHLGYRGALRPWFGLLSLLILAIVALADTNDAGAHAFLVQTSPQQGDRLDSAPAAVKLQFSEPVVEGETELSLRTAEGEEVKTAPLRLTEGGRVVAADLPPLVEGVYVASWRVVALDAHVTFGELAFAVGSSAEIPQTPSRTSSESPLPQAVARWTFLVGLFLAFGGLASERFIWARVERRHGTTVPVMPAGSTLALALLGAGAQLLLSGGVLDPLGSRPSAVTTLTIFLMVAGLWCVRFRLLRVWALAPLAIALGAAGVTGHAGTAAEWWAAPVNTTHLLATALWTGALVHLLLVVWRLHSTEMMQAVVEGARRYAALALPAVVVVLMSGAGDALAQLQRPLDLVNTDYGLILLAKLCLVVLALGVALVARRHGLVLSGTRSGLLRGLVRAESGFVVAAVGAAALLASTAPPLALSAADYLLGPPPMEGPVVRLASMTGNLAVHLAAGEGRLQVQALGTSGEQVPDTRIEMRGWSPEGKELGIHPRPCGSSCVTVEFPWQEGTTVIAVRASAEQAGGDWLRFEVSWPPMPEDPALLDRMIAAMRAQPNVVMTERVSTGFGAAAEHTFTMTGEEFIKEEIFTAGGASDVRPLLSPSESRRFTLYIPGSSMLYSFELDAEERLRQETIVSYGNVIERTFEYDGASEAAPQSR